MVRVCLILLLWLPLAAGATDRYWCDCETGSDPNCAAGDNGNSGLTSSLPKQTWADLSTAWGSIACGDNYYLCRSGAMSGETVGLADVGDDCRSSLITIDDYTDPRWAAQTDADPIVSFTTSGAIADWEDSTGDSRGVSFIDVQLLCEDVHNSGCANNANYAFNFNDNSPPSISHITFTRVNLDGWGDGFYFSSSSSGMEDFTFEDGEIQNIYEHVFHGHGQRFTIDGNYIHDNSVMTGGAEPHLFYMMRGYNDCYDWTISNNFFEDNEYDEGSSNCDSTFIKLGGTRTIIRDNLFLNDSGTMVDFCNGIASDLQGDTDGGCVDCEISRNVWVNVRGISPTNLQDTVIENNVIITEGTPSRSWGIHVSNDLDGIDPNNVQVLNNSIYIESNDSNFQGVRLDINAEGTNYEVVGNVVHLTGTGSGYCFAHDAGVGDLAAFRENLCYRPNKSGTTYIDDDGTPRTLVGWQGEGFGQNSISGTDPDFNTPASHDLRPDAVDSPMVDAGNDSLSPSDAMKWVSPVAGWEDEDHTPDTRGAARDMGAYEWGAAEDGGTGVQGGGFSGGGAN